MIVREQSSTFLLITQPEHGRLAGEIVAATRSEPASLGPERETVLLACHEHDNGWTEVDAEPTVDPRTGRPYDFMSGPLHIKHEIWVRGITRVARSSPRAAALVAEHALTVYAYRRDEHSWASFFASITALRDELLSQVGATTRHARDMFESEYRCVRLGDSWSLQFCNAWHQRQETLGYTATLEAGTLIISPDPFAGATVPLQIEGSAIPARRYSSDAELRAALNESARVTVRGVARGPRPSLGGSECR